MRAHLNALIGRRRGVGFNGCNSPHLDARLNAPLSSVDHHSRLTGVCAAKMLLQKRPQAFHVTLSCTCPSWCASSVRLPLAQWGFNSEEKRVPLHFGRERVGLNPRESVRIVDNMRHCKINVNVSFFP
jgi:hypothetical protein